MRPDPHPVDREPSHTCPEPLELASFPTGWEYDWTTQCENRWTSMPVREGPAVMWYATQNGWKVAAQGRYLGGKRSGTWLRWTRGTRDRCVDEYEKGEKSSSTCP